MPVTPRVIRVCVFFITAMSRQQNAFASDARRREIVCVYQMYQVIDTLVCGFSASARQYETHFEQAPRIKKQYNGLVRNK